MNNFVAFSWLLRLENILEYSVYILSLKKKKKNSFIQEALALGINIEILMTENS